MKNRIVELLEKLGIDAQRLLCRTGLARVYLGRDRNRKEIVIKAAREDVPEDSKQVATALLLHEYDMSKAIGEHPNLCTDYRLHEANIEGDRCYALSMNYIPGKSLCEEIEQSPLQEHTLLDAVCDAGEGAKHVNQQGVLHGDIKPENIIVDKKGKGTLIDFGASNRQHESYPGMLNSLRFITPEYTAPEQMIKEVRAFTEEVDAYQFGATIIKLLTGKGPYELIGISEADHPDYTSPDYTSPVDMKEANPRLAEYPELVKVLEESRRIIPGARPSIDNIVGIVRKHTKFLKAAKRKILPDRKLKSFEPLSFLEVL